MEIEPKSDFKKWWEGRKLIRGREKTYGTIGFIVYIIVVAIIIGTNQ